MLGEELAELIGGKFFPAIRVERAELMPRLQFSRHLEVLDGVCA
jgi:hypothetical protein